MQGHRQIKKVSVQCRNVRLAYGKADMLKDVSRRIEPGEFFALLGPSGSGKSALLRLIAGFDRQQHGQVLLDGVDISPLPPWERHIGMVFQSYALWPHMTVWDNAAFDLVERKTDKATLQRKVGSRVALYDHPVNTFVAGFVGTMSLLPGRVRARSAQTLTLDVEGVGELHFPAAAETSAGGQPRAVGRPPPANVGGP